MVSSGESLWTKKGGDCTDDSGDLTEPPDRARLPDTPEGGGGEMDLGLILLMTPCGGGGDLGRIGGKLALPELPVDATEVFRPEASSADTEGGGGGG